MPTRAEHRRATLLALGNAAVELFETDGPKATIEAIAERAGVSRRTVFRYVDGKEELVYIHPVLWLDIFDAAATAAEGTAAQRLHAGGLAISQHIDADPEPPFRAFVLSVSHPELSRGFTSIFQRWVEHLSNVALNDPHDPDDRFRARVIGSASMGMVDACTREWLLSGGTARFTDLFERGYAQLAPIMEL